MKKSFEKIIIVLLLIIIVILFIFNSKLLAKDNSVLQSKKETADLEKEYDCDFTKTYRIIDKLDYPLLVEGSNYVVVDTFQGYYPSVVVVPSDVYDELELYQYYQFKYTLSGKGTIQNYDNFNSYLVGSLLNRYRGNPTSGTIYVSLEIKKVENLGIEEIQEDFCW